MLYSVAQRNERCDMGRLTEKSQIQKYTRKSNVTVNEVEVKLAYYEDLEEQGLLLRLPCKVGDKAYYLHREYSIETKRWFNEIDEVEVDSFVFNVNLFVNVSLYVGGERFSKTLTPYKTLFFTKDKAEEALKKMQEGSDE